MTYTNETGIERETLNANEIGQKAVLPNTGIFTRITMNYAQIFAPLSLVAAFAAFLLIDTPIMDEFNVWIIVRSCFYVLLSAIVAGVFAEISMKLDARD